MRFYAEIHPAARETFDKMRLVADNWSRFSDCGRAGNLIPCSIIARLLGQRLLDL